MQDLRYPIGTFHVEGQITEDRLRGWIDDIAALPGLIRQAVDGLTEEQLDTPYRPGGWSVRQVVHHLADGHMNSFIRFKWALTEDHPTIKPYDERTWAELPDARTAPPDASLAILDGVCERWALLLRSLPPEAFTRTFLHPKSGVVRLDYAVGMYAWHGHHHVAHITSLRQRMGW